MTECIYCGKNVPLPFTCNYCGLKHCGEHRLPERHSCNGNGFENGKSVPNFKKYITEKFSNRGCIK